SIDAEATPCCHSRESGDPAWVAAFAGMTTGVIVNASDDSLIRARALRAAGEPLLVGAGGGAPRAGGWHASVRLGVRASLDGSGLAIFASAKRRFPSSRGDCRCNRGSIRRIQLSGVRRPPYDRSGLRSLETTTRCNG